MSEWASSLRYSKIRLLCYIPLSSCLPPLSLLFLRLSVAIGQSASEQEDGRAERARLNETANGLVVSRLKRGGITMSSVCLSPCLLCITAAEEIQRAARNNLK